MSAGAIWKNLRTTVATPRKCPGRCFPSRHAATAGGLIVVEKAVWIDFLRGGREDQVYAKLLEAFAIRSCIARVPLKIVVCVELFGVDEDCGNYVVTLKLCRSYKT